jgi:hypothetical protein
MKKGAVMIRIKLMVLAGCMLLQACKSSYDEPKRGNEIQPDKSSGAQPIMGSSDISAPSGMQPIAPGTPPASTGMQPIAPHSNTQTTSSTTSTTVTNPDGSTTTTTTTINDTTTTTTITMPVPSDDPPSIAVTRSATVDEVRLKACSGAATAMDQGMDSNRNGQLDPTEIKETTVECLSSNGSKSINSNPYSPGQN